MQGDLDHSSECLEHDQIIPCESPVPPSEFCFWVFGHRWQRGLRASLHVGNPRSPYHHGTVTETALCHDRQRRSSLAAWRSPILSSREGKRGDASTLDRAMSRPHRLFGVLSLGRVGTGCCESHGSPDRFGDPFARLQSKTAGVAVRTDRCRSEGPRTG